MDIKIFDGDTKDIFVSKENNCRCNQKNENIDVSDHSDDIYCDC